MPRVYKIDDANWKELFKYDYDDLRFGFNLTYNSNVPRKHASDAHQYARDFRKRNAATKRGLWKGSNAIFYSAALTSFSKRTKQSAVTTTMETIEYYNYALSVSSSQVVWNLPRNDQQKLLKNATDRIGRLVYYFTTAYTALPLFEAQEWEEALLLHKKEISSIATDLFYLIRCSAADFILDSLYESTPSPAKLQQALTDYAPKSHRMIPDAERANTRKRIARIIDTIPKEKLAYDSAYFAVDNGSYKIMSKLGLKMVHRSSSHQRPVHGCLS